MVCHILLHRLKVAAIALICYLSTVEAFYVSQIAPVKYKKGDVVDLKYNKIESDTSQLPFAYVDVPFLCHPQKYEFDSLNLGEIFSGDRIIKSGVQFKVLEDVKCGVICEHEFSQIDLNLAKQYIAEDYRAEWLLDGLPAAVEDPFNPGRYEVGFYLGQVDLENNKFYLNNHVDITVLYQFSGSDQEEILITGFRLVPVSAEVEASKCMGGVVDERSDPLELRSASEVTNSADDHDNDDDDVQDVAYTYSLTWKEDGNTDWGRRWDVYIDSSNAQIHWYSIVNSLMLLVVLTAIVAFIMLATLRKDIAAYNKDDEESVDDIIGWKMLHGDVFRTPRRVGHLAAFVGCGVQILVSASLTLLFALFGIFNPSFRGGFLTYALVFWALAGVFAGYYTSRLRKSFKGGRSGVLINAFWTATIFPLILFIVLCVLNTFNWALHSSGALPFGTFVALISIWLFVSLPLVLLGAFFADRKTAAISHPVRTNQIPRQIPEQSIYFKPVPSMIIAGIVPFTVIFMELFFIMKSMWQDQYYYMYGFMALVYILLVITCIEVTIVMIYFQLCGEDYRWQWKSFFVSSSSTWYILTFGIVQYLTKAERVTNYMAGMIFFSYLLIGCVAYFLTTGMIGFWATYAFVRKIYGSIKID
ncbi:hypothetical protein MP228_010982 [Amoeboaphelidium protococcarum]|nr:hypothetical protein MP228_010982 [Amoeboaphelidium protococcarum]